MNNRELAAKLCELGCQLEEAYKDPNSAIVIIERVAAELHKLSNERYEPPKNPTWADLKPINTKPTSKFPF